MAAIEVSACSTHKVPQSLINNVLAICPDADPKDVAKDLVITGSATRTINRILDGQFPAAVNIDFEDTQSDSSACNEAKNAVDYLPSKSSTMSVNRARTTEIHDDSSDTEKYSDSDDDDDVMILHEERKSLFSALKNRMYAKASDKSCTEGSKPAGMHTDSAASYWKNKDNKLTKRPVKTKRTSSIVDLSFSDDDDDDLCVTKKTECKVNAHLPSSETRALNEAADCVMVEPYKSQSDKTHMQDKHASEPECFSKQGTNFVDSPLSDHDTDNCEDSDDFPCVLPSRTSSQSSTSNLSSGNYLDSQDSSEIPVKRKKRTAEEITRQRNEALQKKEEKEREQKAKKEAKEKEKQARQQAKEQLKAQKDKEKLLKKADSLNQKVNNRLDGCIKQIVVCIDPDILTSGQLPEESILLQKLETLGVRHRLESQLIPASITWQRAVVEHDVAETFQISTKTTFIEENHAVLRLTAMKFVEMIFQFREEMQNPAISVIADDETLSAFCERILDIYQGNVVTLVIMGLEKYFRDVKLTQQRQFRSAVLGPNSADAEKPSGKGRKKTNKGSGPSVMVSRVDVEEALVDLQLRHPNCRVRMCETEEEFADMLAMFTKAVAEAPFKKKQPETFSFCVEGGEKGSVKVSKEGVGLKKVWQQQFQQFRNVSADMAAAIVAVYPTPQSLLQAYKRCNSREEAAKLLQDILVRRGAGVLATSRRIGPELSRRVHMLLTSEDGDLSMK